MACLAPSPAAAAQAAGVPTPAAQPGAAPVRQADPQAAAPAAQPAQPLREPPAGSGAVVRTIELAFPSQGGVSVIEPQTYLYYIQTRPSRPSENVWVPYDEQSLLADFRRLWSTNFLDDLSIEVRDVPYANGVVGKYVVFNMEERQRVKLVEYVGTKKLESNKIDEKLKELGAQIRLDSFVDPGLIRRVDGVIRDMLSEKGYLGADVKHEVKPIPGGPKLVNLTFTIDEGPQYKIRSIEFVGNQAVSDGKLKGKMKENKEQGMLSFITSKGTYQEAKFEEDAEKVVEYYRDRGYIAARVGQPELKTIEDTADKKKRWIQLRIPVVEGDRYRVGKFEFAGNEMVKSEALRALFKTKEGDFYAEKHIRKGLEKAREVYGAGGYFEFTGFPDLAPRNLPVEGDEAALSATPAPEVSGPPIVDVTMRLQEGKQYFVNRITFVGNTTTRDNVIRREMRLYENGVFNTESLKYSIKRLNQLGYFKNLEGDAIKVDKTPNADNKVDVQLKFEEQNRNQLTFGAGVSQYEGFFGQLSFQTANFMGRGETLTVAIQAGSRARNYQVAFTEPFLFDRPITGAFDVYSRRIRYINQYTQESTGTNIGFGFPLADFTRAFASYSFERARVTELNPVFLDPEFIANNPFLAEYLLLGKGGYRTISKVTPTVLHNTIDNPMYPTTGRKLTGTIDLAGLGGNTSFYKPRAEYVQYFQQSRRTSFAYRAAVEYVAPFGSTLDLPIFERIALGGEYSVRGFDIRSIGPRTETGLMLGGNKSLLFNVEYLIGIAGPVRLVLFYDAGQVQNRSDPLTWNGFKTSTGAEVRFFMPVLNVPFRLIFAANPQREGVLNNNLEPQKSFTFRFAVGSTF